MRTSEWKIFVSAAPKLAKEEVQDSLFGPECLFSKIPGLALLTL